jgi:hypothetical protein
MRVKTKKPLPKVSFSLKLVYANASERGHMREETNDNDLQEIITQYLQILKKQLGDSYDPEKVNLAEMERKTNISRGKLRKLKKDGFVVKPNGNAGKKLRAQC